MEIRSKASPTSILISLICMMILREKILVSSKRSRPISIYVQFQRCTWTSWWRLVRPWILFRYKSLRSEIALTLKHLLLSLSNCRKLLILECSIFHVIKKKSFFFMFVYDKNKDTLWIGSIVGKLHLCSAINQSITFIYRRLETFSETLVGSCTSGYLSDTWYRYWTEWKIHEVIK